MWEKKEKNMSHTYWELNATFFKIYLFSLKNLNRWGRGEPLGKVLTSEAKCSLAKSLELYIDRRVIMRLETCFLWGFNLAPISQMQRHQPLHNGFQVQVPQVSSVLKMWQCFKEQSWPGAWFALHLACHSHYSGVNEVEKVCVDDPKLKLCMYHFFLYELVSGQHD